MAISITETDVYPYLTEDEIKNITDILLEACSRNGKDFKIFTPVLRIDSV